MPENYEVSYEVAKRIAMMHDGVWDSLDYRVPSWGDAMNDTVVSALADSGFTADDNSLFVTLLEIGFMLGVNHAIKNTNDLPWRNKSVDEPTEPVFTYKVERVESAVTFGPSWAVVQYVDGVAKGGDHHWLSENYAHRARMLYNHDSSLFGLLPNELEDVWTERFGGEMFHPVFGYKVDLP